MRPVIHRDRTFEYEGRRYCHLNFAAVAEASGLSEPRLRRITSKTNPRPLRVHEMRAIAAALAVVPRSWFEAGRWEDGGPTMPPDNTPTLAERVAQLERDVAALRDA